jgi:hypothetical protein
LQFHVHMMVQKQLISKSDTKDLFLGRRYSNVHYLFEQLKEDQ